MASESDVKFLKGSVNLLSEYRDKQSKDLSQRLDFFVQAATKKFGSIENIKKTGNEPVESEEDIKLIKRIINLKSFAAIPFFSQDGKTITQIYTIGMWYYWGLPEIFIKFEEPVSAKGGIEYIGILINLIHDTLFDMFKNKIIKDVKNNDTINRIDYGSQNKSIYVNLEHFDMSFKLCNVDENDYMDLKAYIMLWFYMYYMTADVDKDGTPKLYPVYRIDIKRKKYSVICKNIAKVLSITRETVSTTTDTSDFDDSSSDSQNDSKVENLDQDE